MAKSAQKREKRQLGMIMIMTMKLRLFTSVMRNFPHSHNKYIEEWFN